MIKKLGDRLYMTGTSEGSLYPITAWDGDDPYGLRLGVRLELSEKDGAYSVGLYCRAQFFTAEGEVAVFNYAKALKVLKGMTVRLTSPVHISWAVPLGAAGSSPMFSVKLLQQGVIDQYIEVHHQLKKAFGMEVLSDAELSAIAHERFIESFGGSPSEADIEQKMEGGDTDFDFLSLLAKKDDDKGKEAPDAE